MRFTYIRGRVLGVDRLLYQKSRQSISSGLALCVA
ncbi:unnamed protein product [Arabidopsis lyrata]|nr:unnamed protein product [Arabidopsis lyrata]